VLVLVCTASCFSQKYEQVDAVVAQYTNTFETIKQLANRIQTDFSSDEDRARASYYWISNNIWYDYHGLENNINHYEQIKIKDYKDPNELMIKQDKEYAKICFKKRKAVCHGYSLIFWELCNNLNIESVKITGYTKQYTNQIGRVPKKTDHVWNAVKIENDWKLIDVTWSTGLHSKYVKKITFSDEYFFTDPNHFVLNHLPKDEKWQLLKNPISKSTFAYRPVLNSYYFSSKTKIDLNQKGLLKIKPDQKNIKLYFKTIDPNQNYSCKFNNEKYSTDISFVKKNDLYVAKIKIPKKRSGKLLIFNNAYAIIAYKLLYY
jgi:transglutaminase/protease-like cytokinesis protein 3